MGLVRASERTEAGHRRYSEADVHRLYQVVALTQIMEVMRMHETYYTPEQLAQLEARREEAGHRGNGFGHVAVTSRCGTQSSTCTKPSKRPSSSSTTSKKERR